MRAAIPTVLVCRAVFDASTSRNCRIALVILLTIGAMTPLTEFVSQGEMICQTKTNMFRPNLDEIPSLFAVHRSFRRTDIMDGFAGQYLGSPNSPFYQFLAKEAEEPHSNVSSRQ